MTHAFPKCISPEENVTARPGFELACFEASVQHFSLKTMNMQQFKNKQIANIYLCNFIFGYRVLRLYMVILNNI